jgi:crotonobetainyl-CoA:carnitine CoA-transferase CaiB-like acyl-CoA transferase
MSALLDGVTVGLLGPDRPLAVAARCLADLGATVKAAGAAERDGPDRLWLGEWEQLGEGESVDIALHGRGRSARARTRVRYLPVASAAANSGQNLSERQLSAVGGIAVAVGEPDRPPLPLPEGAVDTMIGTHLAAAGLAALVDGVSETEVAGADVLAWAVATNLHLYLPYGLQWHRSGRRANGSGSCYPYALFEAADGLFCMIGRTDADWLALLEAMGNPAWSATPRFREPREVGRRHADEADRHVLGWTRGQTREQLLGLMLRHSFPGAPVLSPSEVLAWPSLAERWRRNRDGARAIGVPGPPFDTSVGSSSGTAKPLSELLVLDLSWVWSGPAVSVALADLGARVIKIESATRPDNSRLRGRPEGAPEAIPSLESSPYFHALNRGKQSLSLNLSTDGGRRALQALAARADVIVENLSAGVVDRFGIPADWVREVNPDCTFLSMRGYRDHPTTRGLRAYAPVLSSSAGLEALVGYPGEPPTGAMSVAFSDALATGQGILLALAGVQRRNSGRGGAEIVLSQFEAAVLANGHNLTRESIRAKPAALDPIEEGEVEVVGADRLANSEWISPGQLGAVEADCLGAIGVSRLPWCRDGSMPPLGAAGPRLGGHTEQLLDDLLGMNGDQVAALRAAGVLE